MLLNLFRCTSIIHFCKMAAIPVRRNRGRQRVRMELMPIEGNRAVTFSKRHNNLFKKANELCTLCGAEAVVIVSSPGEKGFAYGHPSVDTILDRFLLGDGTNPILGQQNPAVNENVKNYNLELTFLKDKLEEEKKRTDQLLEPRTSMHVDALKFLGPVEELTLSELKQMLQSLDELGNNVDVHRYLLEGQSHTMPMPSAGQNLVRQEHSDTMPRQNPIIGHGQALIQQPSMSGGQNFYPTPNPILPSFGDPSQMMMPRSMVRGPYVNPPMMMVPTPMRIIEPSLMVRRGGLGGPVYNPGAFGVPSMAMRLSGLGGPVDNPGAFGVPSMAMRPIGIGGPLPNLGVFGDTSMVMMPSGIGQPLHDPNLPSSSFVPDLMGAGPSNPTTMQPVTQAPHPIHPTDGQFDGRQGMPSSMGMITTSSALRSLASFLMDDNEDNEDGLDAAFNPQGGSCFGSRGFGSGGS